MLDIGWAELMVIGVVALIVVGPKDLPKLFRALGQWVGKARGLARDFQRAMNDAADESGMSDIKKGFDEAADVKGQMGLDGWSDAVKAVKDPLDVKGKVKDAVLGTDDGAAEATPKPAKSAKPAAKKKPAKASAAKTSTKATGAKASDKKTAATSAAKKAPKTAKAAKPAAKKTSNKKAST
jgi:sec-independent protein translocase protein TatB